MVERVWLKSYSPGIPADIDVSQYDSVLDLFDETIKKFADKPAFCNFGRKLSFTHLDELSGRFASFLQKLGGLDRGDRVAVMLPNLLQYPVVLFGILRAGMTVVNVNPLYTARELEAQLADSGAKAIIVLENFAATLQKVIANTAVEHVITSQLGDMMSTPRRWLMNFVVKRVKKIVPRWHIADAMPLRRALRHGGKVPFTPIKLTQNDIAFLQYTGGTTGVAKGAMLSHANMLANLEQTNLWISGSFKEGREITIAPLPMYHIFCLTSTLAFMKWGSLTVLITNPRDLTGFLKELRKWKFSVMTGVNTLFNGLMNTPGFDKLDFSALKVVVGGGAAVHKPVAERWRQLTGAYVTEAYGLTETSPGVCCVPLGSPWDGSIGLPVSSTEVSIRNEAFEALPLWDGVMPIERCTGEICVRGPQVMQGYWNNPEETARTIVGGWLKTGDIGHMNDKGYVTITDRKKDMILVSGFNVYPTEIESVVMMHPDVAECAVIGVPDEHSGEAVKLLVVRRDPSLTQEDIASYCKTQLTGYKRPHQIEFRASLPKTPIGKILRRELRDAEQSLVGGDRS
jgi:long-chain acyl-CoA synthetase